jgi:hypothetical protein
MIDFKEAGGATAEAPSRAFSGATVDAFPATPAEQAGPEVFATEPAGCSGRFGMEFVVLHTTLRRSGCGARQGIRAAIGRGVQIV